MAQADILSKIAIAVKMPQLGEKRRLKDLLKRSTYFCYTRPATQVIFASTPNW